MAWRPQAEAQAGGVLREPAPHYTSLETEVWIPTAQAAIVSAAWALLGGLVVGGLAYWQRWPWWIAPLVAIATAVVLFAWRVTAQIAEHRERL